MSILKDLQEEYINKVEEFLQIHKELGDLFENNPNTKEELDKMEDLLNKSNKKREEAKTIEKDIDRYNKKEKNI